MYFLNSGKLHESENTPCQNGYINYLICIQVTGSKGFLPCVKKCADVKFREINIIQIIYSQSEPRFISVYIKPNGRKTNEPVMSQDRITSFSSWYVQMPDDDRPRQPAVDHGGGRSAARGIRAAARPQRAGAGLPVWKAQPVCHRAHALPVHAAPEGAPFLPGKATTGHDAECPSPPRPRRRIEHTVSADERLSLTAVAPQGARKSVLSKILSA
jgi:hypothetical protein